MGGEELVACCGINAFQTADVKAFVVILELALMDGDVPKLRIETPPPLFPGFQTTSEFSPTANKIGPGLLARTLSINIAGTVV